MKRRSKWALGSLASLLLLSSAARAWDSARSAKTARVGSTSSPSGDLLASALPDDSLFIVEAPGLAALIAQGPNSPLVQALDASPTIRALLKQAEPSPEQLIEQGSQILDTPLLPRLASLFAGGLAIGMSPGNSKPHWTVVGCGTDAEQTQESLWRVLQFAGEQAGYPKALNRPHDTVEGADVWYIGEEFAVARSGAFLAASTSHDLLHDTLATLADFKPSHKSEQAPASTPALRVTLRAEDWIEAQGVKGAKKLREMRASAARPAVQFLLGPSLALLTRSSDFRAELFVEEEDLRLRIDGTGIDAGSFAKLLPGQAESFDQRPPNLRPTVAGADLLLYRDIDALFEHRADLFPVDTLPKFAEAISNLTLFLGGMDLTDEVLPGLSPWMRLVVDEVVFDEGARPAQPLPAACLLVEVKDNERLGGSLVAAFQSAISLTNIERAQQAKPPFLLGIELVEGVQMSKAHYLLASPEDGVDMEYNLAPACALVDSTFVLGTHKDLVSRVVRELAAGEPTKTPEQPLAENLALPGILLINALVDNIDTLVMSKVLEEGVSKSEAKAEFDAVLGILELINNLSLEVSPRDSDHVAVELRLDLRSKSEFPFRTDNGSAVAR